MKHAGKSGSQKMRLVVHKHSSTELRATSSAKAQCDCMLGKVCPCVRQEVLLFEMGFILLDV